MRVKGLLYEYNNAYMFHDVFASAPGMLLLSEGRLGDRAGGESSSELATVLMASW